MQRGNGGGYRLAGKVGVQDVDGIRGWKNARVRQENLAAAMERYRVTCIISAHFDADRLRLRRQCRHAAVLCLEIYEADQDFDPTLGRGDCRREY